MPEPLRRVSLRELWRWLAEAVQPLPGERVPVAMAAGRVLEESVVARVPLPGFAKAAMDGYALRYADLTRGQPLTTIGESKPGQGFPGTVPEGACVRIATGAPIPQGADTVAPIEQVEQLDAGRIQVRGQLPPGKHVIATGEDVQPGQVLIPPRILHPHDLAMLTAQGIGEVSVIRRPRVAVFVTGNELLPPGSEPGGHHIIDCNSPMLEAFLPRDGADSLGAQAIPDDPVAIRNALQQCQADVILVTGGTSAGAEDYLPGVVRELGELQVHGVAMKPGAPTSLGRRADGCYIVLLPGNPVACYCGYELVARRIIRHRGARDPDLPYRTRQFRIAADVPSVLRRTDILWVLQQDNGRMLPLPGGATNLSRLTQADGFVLIPEESAGLHAGEDVTVYQYPHD